MLHKKIRIPKDSAIDIMEELGKLDDCIQFVDLNIHDYNQRNNFGNLIERCDQSLKNIYSFENIIQLYGLNLIKYNSYQTFKIDLENDKDNINENLNYFDLVEIQINDDKKKIHDLIESYNSITSQLDLLVVKKAVYDKTSDLIFSKLQKNNDKNKNNEDKFRNDINVLHSRTPGELIDSENENKKINLLDDNSLIESSFISGVIKAEDDFKFKRMIFRVSRDRAFSSFFDLTIENKAIKIKKEKKIFIIFLQGGPNSVLFQKILNICDIFSANRFTIPKREKLVKEIFNLQQEIFDKKTYLRSVETSIKDFFKDKIGENGVPGKYDMYKLYFFQERLLFINLNKCKLVGNFLDGEVWIPEEKLLLVQNALLKVIQKNSSKLSAVLNDIDNNINPPTYFKLNDFTSPFQMIVNEYGIPRYREINPGLFTIITFPFMFGVMFGDIGHGGLLTLLGLWLVLKKNEILKNFPYLKTLVKNRYFFLFLGIFAFYNGIIYNDFFAMPLGIFGSCYKNKKKDGGIEVIRKKNCVYPIGLDPKWYSAVNELSFLNSFKMKMSVIIGVLQMILGLLLKGINGIYFRDYLDFLFEFIPQLIFMCLLFGYMILMIYIKWGTDWSSDTSKAPSIISQLLMIFLNLGSTGPTGYKTPLYHKDDYSIQEKFQLYALIISIICIPVMLLVKPTIEYFRISKNKILNNKITITDLAVNQIIETIEYVLGTVSHTASYLRLWALSLAHAQLAKVFFDITLLGFIQSGNIFGMFFGFFLLANITLGVLMGMDLLECALHTLRLHWVEFQSKFYHADGYPFSPYSFKYINDEFL